MSKLGTSVGLLFRNRLVYRLAIGLAARVDGRGQALFVPLYGGLAALQRFAGLLAQLKRDYASVKHAKPPASRPQSAEVYVVATGFRGGK